MYYAASRPLTPVPPASRSKMTPQASSSQGGRPTRNVRFYSDSVQTLALQQNDARCHKETISFPIYLSLKSGFPNTDGMRS